MILSRKGWDNLTIYMAEVDAGVRKPNEWTDEHSKDDIGKRKMI